MAEDSKWELAIAEIVYGFYRKLFRDSVQEPLPLPADLHKLSLAELDSEFPDPLSRLRGWLKLLDLAVTPSMLRQALAPDVDPEIAETLLRYYARKRGGNDADRDKADFVATFLYRYPRVPGQWETRGYTLDGVVPVPPFEIALIEILAEADPEPLAEECIPILREFDLLREELEACATLESLTDVGIVQKGRDLKQALGISFYHPSVLAAVGPYNAAVGKRLEELFRAATSQLKSFAESVHREGGDVTSPVEGKVTVQHLAQIEENEILKTEYAAAQEKFRRVSKVKKAVDKRQAGDAQPAPEAAAPEAKKPAQPEHVAKAPHPASEKFCQPLRKEQQPEETETSPEPARTPKFVGRPAPQMPKFNVPAASIPSHEAPDSGFSGQATAAQPARLYDPQVEEGKLRSVEDSIRVFVRAADPKYRQIVPMRNSNLTLTPVEADACGADYWDEKSFRGDYARTLGRIVAMAARTSTELPELKQRQNSAHLWKPHASALKYLLDTYATIFEQANSVLVVAGQRGLSEKINAMRESLQKTRTRLDSAEQLLRELELKS